MTLIIGVCVLVLAGVVAVETGRRRRETRMLQTKLDRVLTRLGLDPETGEAIE